MPRSTRSSHKSLDSNGIDIVESHDKASIANGDKSSLPNGNVITNGTSADSSSDYMTPGCTPSKKSRLTLDSPIVVNNINKTSIACQPAKSITAESQVLTAHSKVVENGDKSNIKKLPMDVPMEERLKSILDQASSSAQTLGEESSANHSSVILLTQALHSQDQQKLKNVLRKTDVNELNSTVSELPLDLVVPLVNELNQRIRIKSDVLSAIAWLQCVISTHMSYLTSMPDAESHLLPLQEYMNGRLDNFQRLLSLQGRLNLIVNSVKRKQGQQPAQIYVPSAIFQDDWSSDSESEDGLDLAVSAVTSMQSDTDGEANQWWNEQEDHSDSDASKSKGESEDESGGESEGEDESMHDEDENEEGDEMPQ